MAALATHLRRHRGALTVTYGGAVLENPPAPVCGDINCDGFVGAQDIAMLLSAWGPAPTYVRSDLNADGLVDSRDIAILLSRW